MFFPATSSSTSRVSDVSSRVYDLGYSHRILFVAMVLGCHLLLASTAVEVEGGLTTTPDGHILTAPLSVYGNVSVIDSQGVNQNLLALIQQQSTLLQQQSALLQQQTNLIQELQQQTTSLNASLTKQVNGKYASAAVNPGSSLSTTNVGTGVDITGLSITWSAVPGETFFLEMELMAYTGTTSGSSSCVIMTVALPTGLSIKGGSPRNYLSHCGYPSSSAAQLMTSSTIIVIQVDPNITPHDVTIQGQWFVDSAGTTATMYDSGLVAWSAGAK